MPETALATEARWLASDEAIILKAKCASIENQHKTFYTFRNVKGLSKTPVVYSVP
jgi:hypothetical protein